MNYYFNKNLIENMWIIILYTQNLI